MARGKKEGAQHQAIAQPTVDDLPEHQDNQESRLEPGHPRNLDNDQKLAGADRQGPESYQSMNTGQAVQPAVSGPPGKEGQPDGSQFREEGAWKECGQADNDTGNNDDIKRQSPILPSERDENGQGHKLLRTHPEHEDTIKQTAGA